MAYCTVSEVLDMLKKDMLNNILGNDYIEDAAEQRAKLEPIAAQAIGDADAEINGFLMKRYKVPLSPPPPVINKYSKDIAIYNLVSRQGLDMDERESNYLTRYKNAISFLTNVAKGITDVIVEGTKTQAAKSSFHVSSNERLFSRNSMRGM